MGVGARARLVVYDREAGAEFLVLGVVVWTLVWGTFMLAGGYDTTDRMRLFRACATTEETDCRWYHCSHAQLANVSNYHHRR
jgi:hypothetical protein